MRKSSIRFLTLASTLFFIAVLAACTTDETDDLPPYPDLTSLDAEAGMVYPDTVAFDASTGTFDTGAMTVEQVLDKARLAAVKIVSYKSRGTLMSRRSTSGFKEAIHEFSEHASNGNYRFGSELPDPYDDDVDRNEFRTVGIQNFTFNSHEGWKELSEPRSEPRVVLAVNNFLRMLDSEGIQLRSTNERTEGGVKVYRLEFTEQRGQPVRDGYEIETMTTTLLVSQESFRIVAMLRDARANLYDVTTAREIGPSTHSRWIESVSTTYYYDFNEPVVIEIPDEYTPWSETVMLR